MGACKRAHTPALARHALLNIALQQLRHNANLVSARRARAHEQCDVGVIDFAEGKENVLRQKCGLKIARKKNMNMNNPQ